MTSAGTFYTNSEHVTGLEESLVYNVHVLVNSLYVCFNVLFFFVVVCVYVFLFFSFLVFFVFCCCCCCCFFFGGDCLNTHSFTRDSKTEKDVERQKFFFSAIANHNSVDWYKTGIHGTWNLAHYS